MYTVYRLENIVTKKNYIGMTSQEPKERWCSGYRGKMKEAIATYPLDLCWKKHIEFQTPNKEQALELEAELMKWYDSVDNGYNTSAFDNYKYERTEEYRKKISKALTGEKNPMYGMTGENNPWYGKHHTEESKKKMSQAKIGEKHPFYGKHLSEETRRKMSESHGVNGILQYSKDGDFIAEYPSIREAERHTGCHHAHICACCKGKYKSTGGYIWRYKD